MISKNEGCRFESFKVFDAYSNDFKIYEITILNETQLNRLKFKMYLKEESGKIYSSFFNI